MHVVVDQGNCVRIVRTADEMRAPAGMRYPNVLGRDVTTMVPDAQQEQLREVLAAVRQSRVVRTWRFPSAIVPGEYRILRAYPAKRAGWVAFSVAALVAA